MGKTINKSSFSEFYRSYTDYLVTLMNKMNIEPLIEMVEIIKETYFNNKTIFLIGNGGSASTCSHMANDMGIGIYVKGGNKKPIKVISLAENNSIITALSNDDSYENVFIRQLEVAYSEGDLLIAISSSGNSMNLVKAVEWVKNKNGKVVSIVGFDGGILKKISDISVHIESEIGNYGPVEDIQMILNHLVFMWLQKDI